MKINMFKKLFGSTSSAAVALQAVDFLKEPTHALAYCKARSTDAALIAASLEWRSLQAGVATCSCMGAFIHRVYGGLSDVGKPFWGVVELGGSKFLVECEEQVLAYLVARQDVRDRAAHQVPALLLPAQE